MADQKETDKETKPKQDQNNLVWMDCEFTGLDISKHKICEIAIIITDSSLNELVCSESLVVKLSDNDIDNMSEWCKKQFSGSDGLIEKIKNSKLTVDVIENKLLDLIKLYLPPRKGLLCGNSIWSDRKFLQKDFPKIHKYLAYRMIDITAIKELCRRWYPDEYKVIKEKYKKKQNHRALDDVKESIQELKNYKQYIFK